jgi:hypothetical protein
LAHGANFPSPGRFHGGALTFLSGFCYLGSMKAILIFSALILSFSGYSQSTLKDSAVNCVARWRSGEKRTYLITHEKSTITESGRSAPFRFAYEAQVSVLDSTARSYTVKWVFHIPDEYKKMHAGLADSLPAFNGMTMIFKTSEMGAFVELINWEEVRDAYFRQTEISLSKKNNSIAATAIKHAKEMFGSREAVESALIKEIQLFYTPYGYQFTTKVVSSDAGIPNPFGGDSFPAHQTYQITDIDRTKDAFSLVIHLKTDKAALSNLIDPMLRKMGVKDDAEMAKLRTQMATYDMQDHSEYNFQNSTGWIRNLHYNRTVLAGAFKQSDTYTIELMK